MPYKALPPTEYLRTCFDYDPATGVLRWRYRPREHFSTDGHWKRWNANYAGTCAGRTHPVRYHSVCIDRISRLSHRIIWKWMTGEDPPSDLDHADRDGFNNRWLNLRTATKTQAMWNREMPRSTNPYRGAYRCGKKWRARIRISGITHHLGTFPTPEEAAAAYEATARNLHGHFYVR